jgi:hypothetical protein
MHPERLAEAVALLTELPRFTPAQYQRLFEDAGLRGPKASLFLRSAHKYSPWSMVVESAGAMIDLEAFTSPLPASHLEQAAGADHLLKAARSHMARIELSALEGRCPKEQAHELVARVASGLLRTTYAIAWLHPPTGILMPAAPASAQVRESPRDQVPLELYATVRLSVRPPLVLVDTVGLADFDLADLELEVDEGDAEAARAFLLKLATDLASSRRGLKEGEPIEGPLGVCWKPRVAMSSAPPNRAVMRLQLAG